MQVTQIKQELSQVDQIIQRAARAIQGDKSAPQELKECVRTLEQQSKKAQSANDEQSLTQCVDDMEDASDRAKAAVEKSMQVATETKDAVLQTHRKLSSLKHQLQ
jgi:hypothetical protein